MRWTLSLLLCTLSLSSVTPLSARPCCCDDLEPLPTHPITLLEAEDIAIRNNKAIRSLRQIAAQGQYQVIQAWSQWLPQIDLGQRVRWRYTNASSSTTRFQNTILTFSQNLFNPTAYYGVRLSYIDEELLCTDFAILKNEIRFQVRTAYYDIILQEGQTLVQSENVEILRDALTLEERKFQVGETTRFDVNQAKVSVANALSDYFASRRNLKLARNDFLRLLGYDPSQEFSLAESSMPVRSISMLNERIKRITVQAEAEPVKLGETEGRDRWEQVSVAFGEEEIVQWEDIAYSCQPEIHKRRLLSDSARERESQLYGDYLPSVKLFTDQNFNRSRPARSHDVGFALSWKLFDGFNREAKISKQGLAVCSADIELEKILQDTKTSLHNRFEEIEEAVLSYYAAQESVTLGEQALDLARARRQLGVITPIQFRETARDLTSARQQLNLASFGLLRSYYLLRQQAGADFRDACLAEAELGYDDACCQEPYCDTPDGATPSCNTVECADAEPDECEPEAESEDCSSPDGWLKCEE